MPALALAAERILIYDTLCRATVGERFGGTLDAEGYHPQGPQDHVLYRLPAFFANGYAAFEIRGMRAIAGGDPALIGIYDGRGIQEPARYFEDFRDNHYRFNLHWRGNRGAMKAVVVCAEPTPVRWSAARAVFNDETHRDWSAEPTGESVAWDPHRWHRVRVTWSPKEIVISIDDHPVWRQALRFPYLPQEPRLWLGSAPGRGTKYTHQIDGLTFRNFRLVAVQARGH